MKDEIYSRVFDVTLNGVESIKRTGLELLECGGRYAKFLMPLKNNTNHIGIMYAGPLFVIGEVAGGAAFIVSMDYKKYFPIVKNVDIRFIKPAMSDITLDVRTEPEWAELTEKEVEEKGKADFEMDFELKDSVGETVAKVHGKWQIRKTPPGMKLPWM